MTDFQKFVGSPITWHLCQVTGKEECWKQKDCVLCRELLDNVLSKERLIRFKEPNMERKCSLLLDRREVWLSTGQPNPYSDEWDAIDANRYDASFEGSDEAGNHWSESGGHGWGKTEQEAIEDLFDQLEEQCA